MSKINFELDFVFCLVVDSISIIIFIFYFIKTQFLRKIQNINKIIQNIIKFFDFK